MNQITIPKGMGHISKAFAGTYVDNNDLGGGVTGGFGVIGYKGKVWSIKHNGENIPLLRQDDGTPRGSIEVVLIKSSPYLAKRYYAGGFVEGSSSPPDCQSSNGVRPDAGVAKPQAPACATCPQNVWGSRISESGKPGRACADGRRVAIVPMDDVVNEVYGGPMLLNIPAASLKDLKAYGDKLQQGGYPYFAVATRISFDHNEAFPKFVFSPIRVLTDEEAAQIVEWQTSPQVQRILNDSILEAPPAAEGPSPIQFEQPPAPKGPAPKPAPAPAKQELPPHDPDTGEVDEEAELLAKLAAARKAKAAAKAPAKAPEPEVKAEGAPGNFDDMLESLLPK